MTNRRAHRVAEVASELGIAEETVRRALARGATPSLPDALALAIQLAVKRQARLHAEARRTIRLVEQPGRKP